MRAHEDEVGMRDEVAALFVGDADERAERRALEALDVDCHVPAATVRLRSMAESSSTALASTLGRRQWQDMLVAVRDEYTAGLRGDPVLVRKEQHVERAIMELERVFPRGVNVLHVRTQKFKTAFEAVFERGGWMLPDRRPTALMRAVEYALAVYCRNTDQVQRLKTGLGQRGYRIDLRWFGDRKRAEEKSRWIANWYRKTYPTRRSQARLKTVLWRGLPTSITVKSRGRNPDVTFPITAPSMTAWVLTLPQIGKKSSLQGMVTFLHSRRGFGPNLQVDLLHEDR